ncbi:MAG: ATP-binding cassette domain-containing protein, partial [Candidatus Aminicenantales bacterium]
MTAKFEVRDLAVAYGKVQGLKALTVDIYENEILSIIGPSNSGKTSFLRTLNRLNDLEPLARTTGTVKLDGRDIFKDMSAEFLRQRVGMIFALPIPLPLSIYDNVAYGPRMSGVRAKRELDARVESSLQAAYLWDEVKDRLDCPGQKLSGGQQQRL